MKFFIKKGTSFRMTSVVYTDSENLIPANLTGATITAMLKKNLLDNDTKALFSKSIGTGVTVLSEPDGTLETEILATDTNNISYQVVFFEVLVKLANGNYIRSDTEEIVLEKNIVNVLN